MAHQKKIGNSDKSMTAVEWLFDKLKSHFEHDGDLLEGVIMTVEQAKQMEIEQIIQAYVEGINLVPCNVNSTDELDAEQYYNETFGNK